MNTRGFTLVEIMIAVIIVGVLAALAIPAFTRVTQRTKVTKVVNDLRQFRDAFDTYSLEKGTWPDEVDAQIVPPEMDGRMSSAVWINALPGGHHYDWDNGVSGVTAAISIRPVAAGATPEFFNAIDSILDDGNAASGRFRLVNDRYMLILQE